MSYAVSTAIMQRMVSGAINVPNACAGISANLGGLMLKNANGKVWIAALDAADMLSVCCDHLQRERAIVARLIDATNWHQGQAAFEVESD